MTMESNWNFQGYIALPIERYGRKYIGESFPTASTIADGEFVDAMLQILLITYGDLKQVSDFVEQCNEYDGLSYNNIPQDVAISLFRDFERLIREYEKREAKQ